MNEPLCRLRRSDWFLAHAKDTNKSPLEREAAWRCSDLEFWYECVSQRGLPLLSAPTEHVARIRALILERHEGSLSGFQLRA